MTNKKKTKKVNQLKLKECEEILVRLAGQTENKYYQHVLNHYRNLIPSHEYAIELGKIKSDDNASLPSI